MARADRIVIVMKQLARRLLSRTWVSTGAFALALTLSTSALAVSGAVALSAGGWSASGDVKAQLGEGKVIVETHKVGDSEFPMFRGFGVVAAPPEAVWGVVADCGNYSKTLARIERSRLVSKQGDKVRCESVLDFPAPFDDARVVSDAIHRQLPGRRFERSWTFVEGDFDENRGTWTILPFDSEGQTSLVVYETHAEPHARISPTLLKMAQRRAMPNLYKRLRAAVGAPG